MQSAKTEGAREAAQVPLVTKDTRLDFPSHGRPAGSRSGLSEFVDVTSKIVTTIAVIVAGFWTYMLFIQNREAYARANLKHEIDVIDIDGERRLLRINVLIENTGNVMLRLGEGEVRVEKVLPLSRRIQKTLDERVNPVFEGSDFFSWPAIRIRHSEWDSGEFEIEPGEVDDTHYEFILSSNYEVISIYTHFDNIEKQDEQPGIGWDHSTLLDLRGHESTG